MYKDSKRTCTAIVLVFGEARHCRRRGFAKTLLQLSEYRERLHFG